MLVGVPAWRYRFRGEYIQTAITTPIRAAMVPMRDDHTTNENHWRPFLRSGVKYSQCGMAPM